MSKPKPFPPIYKRNPPPGRLEAIAAEARKRRNAAEIDARAEKDNSVRSWRTWKYAGDVKASAEGETEE